MLKDPGVDVRRRQQKWTSSAASSNWPIRWPRRGSSSQRSWEKEAHCKANNVGAKAHTKRQSQHPTNSCSNSVDLGTKHLAVTSIRKSVGQVSLSGS